MAEEKVKKKQRHRAHTIGLSPILWLCFMIFAVIIILFLTLVQVIQYRSSNRSRIMDNLTKVCDALEVVLPYYSLDLRILESTMFYANMYSVSIYVIGTQSKNIFPVILYDDLKEYMDLYDHLQEEYSGLDYDPWELPPEEVHNIRHTVVGKDYVACESVVKLINENCFLYVTSSLEQFNNSMKDMVVNAVFSGLFAIALCFIMSGLVSMLVGQPVASVTGRAKTLAHGEYDVSYSGHYFIREVNDLSEAINYAGVELSKTDQIQKELIANVSHDFRTPLTMIKAYAAMIQEISGEDPVKRKKHTQIIIDETDRLAALVRDLLDLSRLQAGVYSFENTVFNLSEDLYSVSGRFGFLEQTRGFTIKTEIEDDLYTYANKQRIEQVLYNLIGNAVNYTGEDKTVIIRLKKQEGCSRFEVADSGKGIPPEQIATIWERYYRSTETHKRPVEGTGLGLSIVKNVLKMHGFNFGVESEPGKGSTFWVEFPDPPAKDGGEGGEASE